MSIWGETSADFPVRGTPREKLAFAVTRAAYALPEHWRQPWEIRLDDRFAELRASVGRASDAVDPDGRETLMSCGAALEFLELILKHHGCMGRIEPFPDLNQPALVARVHAGRGIEREASESRLFVAMSASSGRSFWTHGEMLPEAAMGLLQKVASRARTLLEFARCEASRERLRQLFTPQAALQIEALQMHSPLQERRMNGGLTVCTRTRWLLDRIARWSRPRLAVRVVAAPSAQSESRHPRREPEPASAMYAVVKTKTDDKHGWIAAGRTVGRLRLQAFAMDMDCAVRNETLRSSRLRSELRPEFGRKGFVQAILRFAYRRESGVAHKTSRPLSQPHSTAAAAGQLVA